jgi:hypothetical protein
MHTAEWLTTHGFDGLYDASGKFDECGCEVGNLRPCDKDWRQGRKCRPGIDTVLSDGTHVIGPKEK